MMQLSICGNYEDIKSGFIRLTCLPITVGAPMGPGKLVRHMQNPSYTYDEYLICIGLGPSISFVICNNLLYSGPSYPSSPVYLKTTLFKLYFGVLIYQLDSWQVNSK